MKYYSKLTPLVGALFAGTILVNPAFAAPVTLNLPANQSAQCVDLFDNGCAVSDSTGDSSVPNIAFTFPNADLNAGEDWCFNVQPGNTTLLSFNSSDSIALEITQLCLKSDPTDVGRDP